MIHRHYQPVSAALAQRAKQFGEAAVAGGHFRNGYTMNNADRDPMLQGLGKIGEVAAALFFRLSPDHAVNWNVDQPDNGADLCLPNGVLVDVKASYPHRKLIWHKSKNGAYWDKKFDVLLSVSIEQHDWRHCWIEGHISKREFYERKLIADGSNCRLQIGTWFMEKAALNDPAELQHHALLHLYGAQAWDRLYGSMAG